MRGGGESDSQSPRRWKTCWTTTCSEQPARQTEAERLLAGARDLEESIGVSLSAPFDLRCAPHWWQLADLLSPAAAWHGLHTLLRHQLLPDACVLRQPLLTKGRIWGWQWGNGHALYSP